MRRIDREIPDRETIDQIIAAAGVCRLAYPTVTSRILSPSRLAMMANRFISIPPWKA